MGTRSTKVRFTTRPAAYSRVVYVDLEVVKDACESIRRFLAWDTLSNRGID